MTIEDDLALLMAPTPYPGLDVLTAFSAPAAGAALPTYLVPAEQSPRPVARFLTFGTIGGSVFVAGLALQAFLTGVLGVPAIASYIAQSITSIEASFALNRWFTWGDRGTPFWAALWRFNVQKTVTVLLNLILYAALLQVGVNYLLANIVLTAVFTVVNYVAGDRFVFRPARKALAAPSAAGVQPVEPYGRYRDPQLAGSRPPGRHRSQAGRGGYGADLRLRHGYRRAGRHGA